MNKDKENIEVLIKQSMVSQLTDEEIGMPDVEEEMKRIELAVDPTLSSAEPTSSDAPKAPATHALRNIAASVIGLLIISGIAYASVKYGAKYFVKDSPRQEIVKDTIPQLPCDTVPAEIVFDNSYLAEMLDTISNYYDMRVVFANDDLKVIRLYYTFNPAKSIDKVIRDLNHFNKMTIRREESVIYVNPKQ